MTLTASTQCLPWGPGHHPVSDLFFTAKEEHLSHVCAPLQNATFPRADVVSHSRS